MVPPVEVGQIVAGKYVVERVIAHGGAGVVVKAKHVQLLEPCAIKFMLPRAVVTPIALERFFREARACARLKSDHVVKVFDIGELEVGADKPRTPYMVLEYLEGLDLEERMAKGKPLPVGEAVLYVLQICVGLADAHALGIVHRDLKPGNVYLCRLADGTTRVKLLDFGISKDLSDAPGDDQSRTEDGVLVGSPLFMAPEQVRGDDIDTRADLWSVGVILYYLLTGSYPFEGRKASETMAHILTRAPIPPAKRNPALPPDLGRLILQCLEKDPAKRPANASELAGMLTAFADEEALITLPVRRLLGSSGRFTKPPSSPGLPPPARRRLLPAAIAGCAVAAVAVVGLALRSRAAPSPAPASSTLPAPLLSAPSAATMPPPADTSLPSTSASAPLPGSAAPGLAPPAQPSASAPPLYRRRPGPLPGRGVPSRGFDLGSRH
jgi:serine/threonine-protein kinase